MASQKETSDRGNTIQARGVWHRPNVTGAETNLEGICSVLDTFQHTGINLVFLEVFYHGMTVFKTSTVEYYTGFEAFDYGLYPDYLSAFVAEAQKRNIEVHAWVEDFYIGVKTNRFVKNCPQWLLKNSQGSYRQSEGADYGGYIFLDPANSEVRKFLVDFYSELLTKFPQIKGLNLDYIRYPVSSTSDDTGFTKTAMEQFAATQGWILEDDSIETFRAKLKATGAHGKFTDFRAGCVTQFVSEVFQMVREKHPQVLLSTAIFPEPSQSYNQKKQDFAKWLKEGYLDIVTPMAYYDDNGTLKNALQTMMKGCEDTYCYAGLSSTYHNLSNTHVQQQMQVCRDVGADGFVFFGSQSILNKPAYIDFLHDTLGSVKSTDVLPHSSPESLLNALSLPMLEALRQDPREDPDSLAQLENTLQEIRDLGQGSQRGLEEAEGKLKLLAKYNLQAYVSQENLDWTRDALLLLHRYLSVYVRRAEAKALLPADPPIPEVPDTPDIPDIPDTPEIPDTPDVPQSPVESSATCATAPEATAPSQTPEQPKDPVSPIPAIACAGAAVIAAGAAVTVAVNKKKKV